MSGCSHMMVLNIYPGPEVRSAFFVRPRDQPNIWEYALALNIPEGVFEFKRRARGERPRLNVLKKAMRMTSLALRWYLPASEQAAAAAAEGMAMDA